MSPTTSLWRSPSMARTPSRPSRSCRAWRGSGQHALSSPHPAQSSGCFARSPRRPGPPSRPLWALTTRWLPGRASRVRMAGLRVRSGGWHGLPGRRPRCGASPRPWPTAAE
eukprot:8752925-Alexandrium_andersonii.AAC.1